MVPHSPADIAINLVGASAFAIGAFWFSKPLTQLRWHQGKLPIGKMYTSKRPGLGAIQRGAMIMRFGRGMGVGVVVATLLFALFPDLPINLVLYGVTFSCGALGILKIFGPSDEVVKKASVEYDDWLAKRPLP